MSRLETLKFTEPDHLSLHYDAEADVFYLSFGDPQPAIGLDIGDGVFARYVEETSELVGLTFIGLRAFFDRQAAKQRVASGPK